jgi:hypothetical protein
MSGLSPADTGALATAARGCQPGETLSMAENTFGFVSRSPGTGDSEAQAKKSGRNAISAIRRIFAFKRRSTIILIIVFAFPGFFHQFPRDCLLFSVEDSGGFFIIFPFFEFPDDAFFFHHAFKTFNGFFKHLVIIYDDMSQM